ncbi:MAG: 50S ribosomal protein L29 [Patescibacteria group bacterium]
MKKKELQEIKNKTIENLRQLVAEKVKVRVSQAMEQKLGKIKNVHSIREIKRDIAAVKTILAEKMFEEKTKKESVKGLPLK